jgi:CheY-like chemotaxis protein
MSAPHPPARLRALVVDDSADYADCLTQLLSLWGHESAGAYAGPEALAVAARFRPDAVLLDLDLPGMDGYEVARRLRRLPGLGAVALVALTGRWEEGERLRREQGALHVVEPTDAEALRAVVGALARQKFSRGSTNRR